MIKRYLQAQSLASIATIILSLLLIASVLSRIFLSLHYQFNWDEFFFLSKIYQWQQGELSSALQTAYVYGFTWLTALPYDEIGQLQCARLAMVAVHCGSMWFLFKLAQALFDTTSALFAVVAYSSFSYVMVYGASFRADPLLGFCMMAALYLLTQQPLRGKHMVAIAALVSCAVLISIKALLLLPVLCLVAIHQSSHSDQPTLTLRTYSYTALLTGALLALLFYLHSQGLAPNTAIAAAGDTLSNASTSALRFDRILPQQRYLLRAITSRDSLFFILLAVALAAMAMNLGRTKHSHRRRTDLLLIYALPLVTFIFYRNSYPYFYPFILLPVSILLGYIWHLCTLSRYTWLPMLLLALSVPAFTMNIYRDGIRLPLVQNLDSQRQALSVIHAMFPAPVTYIDGSSMVASFPKVGFFMSTWGIKRYRNKGVAQLHDAITAQQPKFVLANTSTRILHNAFNGETLLLPEDALALRQNYIHHWGNIYIAGKQFTLTPDSVTGITIVIEGDYTVTAEHPIHINSQPVASGAVVYLSKGEHQFQSDNEAAQVALRYGRNLLLPQAKPVASRVYQSFY